MRSGHEGTKRTLSWNKRKNAMINWYALDDSVVLARPYMNVDSGYDSLSDIWTAHVPRIVSEFYDTIVCLNDI